MLRVASALRPDARPRTADAREIAAVRDDTVAAVHAGALDAAEWHAAFTEPTPLSAFAALDVPVLFLTGAESPASSRAAARLLTKTLPRVTALELSGAGHMAPLTHPERVNALIDRFLDTANT